MAFNRAFDCDVDGRLESVVVLLVDAQAESAESRTRLGDKHERGDQLVRLSRAILQALIDTSISWQQASAR